MKITIAFLLAFTALIATSTQAKRAADECARLETEIAEYESRLAEGAKLRARTEKRIALHEYALSADSPTDLQQLVQKRHAELVLRQQAAGERQ